MWGTGKVRDLGPDMNVDGDRQGTEQETAHNQGGAPHSTCPSPCLPGGTALWGRPSISTCLPTQLVSSLHFHPVSTLSSSLPSWAGALVTHELSPLSWGQGEVQCRGQERDADCLCDTSLLSDARSRAPAPRWVPQVTFWVLHVGQGMGSQPHLTGNPVQPVLPSAQGSSLTPGRCPRPLSLSSV